MSVSAVSLSSVVSLSHGLSHIKCQQYICVCVLWSWIYTGLCCLSRVNVTIVSPLLLQEHLLFLLLLTPNSFSFSQTDVAARFYCSTWQQSLWRWFSVDAIHYDPNRFWGQISLFCFVSYICCWLICWIGERSPPLVSLTAPDQLLQTPSLSQSVMMLETLSQSFSIALFPK